MGDDSWDGAEPGPQPGGQDSPPIIVEPGERNIPVPHPHSHFEGQPVDDLDTPVSEWVELTNVQATAQDRHLVVVADVTSHVKEPIAAGELLFQIIVKGDFAHFEEMRQTWTQSEHLNASAIPHGTSTCVLGSVELDPGGYEVRVNVLSAQSRSPVARSPEPLHVAQEGQSRPSHEIGQDHSAFGRDLRVEIRDVEHVGPTPDGTHEYRVHYVLTNTTPIRTLEATIFAHGPGGQSAQQNYYLEDAIPAGMTDKAHVLTVNMTPGDDWKILLYVGHGNTAATVHLDADGGVTSIDA